MVGLRIVPTENLAADQAAEWFARQRSGRWSPADAADFAAWLKEQESHARAWARYEQLWTRVGSVRDDPRILALRETAKNSGAGRWRSLGLLTGSAAAAIVAVVGAWVLLRPAPTQHVAAEPAPVTKPAEAPAIRIASTQKGERSLLLLPDGSRITLNSDSSVQTDYSNERRRVTLVRGEAFFQVAKDPARPFVVTAGSRDVVAVGTAFEVRLGERQLRVTLVQGRVRVVPGPHAPATAKTPAEVSLDAGSAMTVLESGSELIEPVDTARAVHWRDGKLNYIIFDEEKLSDVVTEMNRYSPQRLVIADSSLEDRKVSGVFESSAARAVARALEAYGLARADVSSPDVIVLKSP
ncbi:MAG: FecR domain-containing protein [Proteobacteria bacterium]|nr:FecR domain-containing protein [Pseudomonadota bacterium]